MKLSLILYNKPLLLFLDFVDFEDESTGPNVILLVFIIIGIMIASLIFVGVIYNCIKRQKQGRHIFSGKHVKDSLSFKEVDQSDDESDCDSKHSTEKRGSTESIDSQCDLKVKTDTKVDITIENQEETELLEVKESNQNISNQNETSQDTKTAENDLKHIDED